MRHTISLLVENKFGVLARIANLFSGKGYNLDSICVGETENPELSRITEQYFFGEIILFQSKVLLAYLSCGVMNGIFCGAFIKIARDHDQ